jgi:hypothetical protein
MRTALVLLHHLQRVSAVSPSVFAGRDHLNILPYQLPFVALLIPIRSLYRYYSVML